MACTSVSMSRVAIVGAGYAGLTVAALLKRWKPGLQCVVYERASREEWETKRSFPVGLWAPACAVLERLGVDTSETICKAVPGGCYTNRGGTVLAEPSPSVLNGGVAALRFFSREAALLSAIANVAGVEVQFGSDHHVDGRDGAVDADLMVLAHGSPEGTNALAARGYTVYRGVSGRLLDQTPFQAWGPGMRFAVVPLLDGASWYATFVDGHPLLPRSAQMGQKAVGTPWSQERRDILVEELRGAFRGWHAPIDELLVATSTCAGGAAVASRYPWQAVPPPADRVIRLGDAAFTHDPILAVGAGEAILDAAMFVDVVKKRSPRSIG